MNRYKFTIECTLSAKDEREASKKMLGVIIQATQKDIVLVTKKKITKLPF